MGLDIYFYKYRKDDEVPEEIGYFRKVNFLVGFFEGYGMDVVDQEPLVIHPEYITDLIECCRDVLDEPNLANDLLPTYPGFSLDRMNMTIIIMIVLKRF